MLDMSVLVLLVVVILVLVVIPAIVARMRGYPLGGRVVVRCRQGHMFMTVWTPGVSFKAVSLGWWRFQHCPVGKHWTLVSPVEESELTEEQKRLAHNAADVAVP
ncbi:MAG: hypothetical protein ABSB69_06815 [Solirubrobacteraceae bacterium]